MFERIKEVIVEQTGLDAEAITLQSSVKENSQLDSIDYLEILMGLEEEFDIEIPDETAESFQTINDIVKFLTEHN